MSPRHLMNRLYYFTIEDDSMLSEAFARFEQDVYAISYKVRGTDDVFITTHDTKQVMDQHDVPYNLLAEEESSRIAVLHTAQSREELAGYEDALKALALAHRSIALVCLGINGDADLAFDLSEGPHQYTYFTAPSGHTFIWRLFTSRDDAQLFLARRMMGQREALEWGETIPLASAEELSSYH